MGYTTEFSGRFDVTPAMDDELVTYLNDFARKRRMKRDNEKIKEMDPDWQKHCFKGNLGVEGEYYVIPDSVPKSWLEEEPVFGAHADKDGMYTEKYGQIRDKSIVEYDWPPSTQPGLWCQWTFDKDGIEWDEGEKFYNYVDWLKYLIANFLEPNGHTVNGTVRFRGEDFDDVGEITVKNNDVKVTYFFT